MFVGIIICIFGLAMFDLFVIPQPRGVRLKSFKKGSFISTLILGLSSGFVIAPCTTPVLGSILVLLSHKSNVVYGGFLLLCFAYGMGVILLISAVFSAFLTTLPKAGAWMGILKKIYAFILIAAGAYFIINAVRRLVL